MSPNSLINALRRINYTRSRSREVSLGITLKACLTLGFDANEVKTEKELIESLRQNFNSMVSSVGFEELLDSVEVNDLYFDDDLGEALTDTVINKCCAGEGWGLFDVDSTGYLEIQKSDEAGVFDDDDDAFSFVRRLAEAGSRLHSEALDIHNTHLEMKK